MFIGFLVGLIIGCVLANTFIFPADIFNIKLGNLTIGDVLRIFGGVMVILISTSLGIVIGEGDIIESPKSESSNPRKLRTPEGYKWSTPWKITTPEGDMTKSPKSSNEDASQDDDILV